MKMNEKQLDRWLNLDEEGRSIRLSNVSIDDLIIELNVEFSENIKKKKIQLLISSPKKIIACLDKEIVVFVLRGLLHNTIETTSKYGFVGIYFYLGLGKFFFCIENHSFSPDTRELNENKIGVYKNIIKRKNKQKDQLSIRDLLGEFDCEDNNIEVSKVLIEKLGGELWINNIGKFGQRIFSYIPI